MDWASMARRQNQALIFGLSYPGTAPHTWDKLWPARPDEARSVVISFNLLSYKFYVVVIFRIYVVQIRGLARSDEVYDVL